MRKADLVSAAVVTAFGVMLLFVVIPVWVQRHEEGGYGLGARVMPDTMAILVIVLGAMLFAARFLAMRDAETRHIEDEATPMTRSNWVYLLLTSLFLIALVAVFTWVGFLAGGPLTVAGFMIAMGERRPIPIVLTSMLSAGTIWLFFWKLLDVPLS